MNKEKNRWQRIVIHCSDSKWGNGFVINEWHKERGFRLIGYNEYINNGYPTSSWLKAKLKVKHLEAQAEVGRAIGPDVFCDPEECGAHVKGHNTGSYGICMIGWHEFSDAVLNKALDVVIFRLKQFGLEPNEDTVKGHYEFDSEKTCPNINMNVFRSHLKNKTYYGKPVPKKEKKATGAMALLTDMLSRLFNKGKQKCL